MRETPTVETRSLDAIPVAHTPPGGYGSSFPAPVLDGCREPLVADAPDLRGLWRVIAVEVRGWPVGDSHPAYRHVERIEQCGDRLVITGGGVIHDMRCDGTLEHGLHDVAVRNYSSEVNAVATYEAGMHVIRPAGTAARLRNLMRRNTLEITRELDDGEMVWTYATFAARLRRIGGPNDLPPAELPPLEPVLPAEPVLSMEPELPPESEPRR